MTKEKFSYEKLQSVVDFKNVDLENARFQEDTLYGCDFTGCNLHNAKFNGCKLINCVFDYSNLVWAEFNKSTIKDCSFTGADLVGVKGLDVGQVQHELCGQTGRHNFRIALYVDGSRKPSILKEFTAPIVPDGTMCPTAHEIFSGFVPSMDGNFRGEIEDRTESCNGIKVENGLVAHKWTARLELGDDALWLHKAYWTEILGNYTSWVWQSDRFVK